MIYHTLIIGAGQAGLAMGFYLQQKHVPFLILDGASEIGASWRNRYDSLQLFTPARFSQLPGLTFPLPADHLPTKDDMADYLVKYAQHHQLPVSLNQKVKMLTREDGQFIIHCQSGKTFKTRHIVIATGPHQIPFIPVVNLEDIQLKMIHSRDYKNPDQVPAGNTLVVGGGNSAADIASELADKHKVTISTRHKLHFTSLYFLHQNLVWWSHQFKIMYLPADSLPGKLLKKWGEPIFGKKLQQKIRQGKVNEVQEIEKVNKKKVYFKNGERQEFTSIIWATGYNLDFSWISIPALFDGKGAPIHHKGVSSIPGLYFMGLEWQRSRSSALITGVGRDAAYISQRIFKSSTR